MKRRLSHDLLHGRPWDLFITVFGEGHAAGHQQWHLHDPSHPRFDAGVQDFIGGDPIARVYAGLDAALGKLLATVDERTTVLVILSHGMGPHHDGTHLLEEVLRRIDLADRLAGGESWSAAWHRRLGDLKLLLRSTARRLKGAPRREFASALERARQRFFLAPNNYVYGGVRLNKAGREPNGCVRPADVEAVIEGLARDLRALVNTATGDPAIRGVERAEDWYRRSNDDTIPDLFLDWERSGPIETVWSPKIGRVHAPYVNWRTGDHRARGLLLASGPGIAAGASHAEIAIEDLPASLTARFGLAHDDMDGKPVDWLMG
jgi:predicted AlkP superfamily phosphohydrolase/phosphomutase